MKQRNWTRSVRILAGAVLTAPFWLSPAAIAPTPALAAGSYRDEVVHDKPISYWRLGDTGDGFSDELGKNNGTMVGAGDLARQQPSAVDGGASIHLTPAPGDCRAPCVHVEVPNSPSLALRGPVTLEAWIKPEDGSQHNVIEKYDVDHYSGYAIRLLQGHLWGYVCDDSDYTGVTGDTTVTLNEWHHIVFTADGSMLTLYLDGQLYGSKPATRLPTPGKSSLKIGVAGDRWGLFHGFIAEAAIYDYALSADRVQVHFKASGHAGIKCAPPQSAQGGTAALTPFSFVTPGTPQVGTEGTNWTYFLVAFSRSDGDLDPSHFGAQVDWKDGSAAECADVIVNPWDPTTLLIRQNHTYAEAGSYNPVVTVFGVDGSVAEAPSWLSSAFVNDATTEVTAQGFDVSTPIASVADSASAADLVRVAAFTVTEDAMPTDFVATVDWGRHDADESDGIVMTPQEPIDRPGQAQALSKDPQRQFEVYAPNPYGGEEPALYPIVTTISRRDTGDSAQAHSWGHITVPYVIEFKAWIPHNTIVDPEATVITPTSLYQPDCPGAPFIHAAKSEYKGDNHSGYQGSYRVLLKVAFDWDGQQILNFKGPSQLGYPQYGTTHRIVTEVDVNGTTASGRTCQESKTATCCEYAQQTGQIDFGVSYDSAIPLIGPAKLVNATIKAEDHATMLPGESLKIDFWNTGFPSQGIQVTRGNQVLLTAITNDASCLSASDVLGPIPAFWLLVGLKGQWSQRGYVMSSLATQGQAITTRSPLCP